MTAQLVDFLSPAACLEPEITGRLWYGFSWEHTMECAEFQSLGLEARVVYFAITSFVKGDASQSASIGQRLLARRAGVQRRNLPRSLSALVDAGLLAVLNCKRDNGSGGTVHGRTVYVLLTPPSVLGPQTPPGLRFRRLSGQDKRTAWAAIDGGKPRPR